MKRGGLTERVLRGLLSLAPEEFRDRYGDELIDTSVLRIQRAGTQHVARVLVSIRELLGLAVTVMRLRLKTVSRVGHFESALQDVRFAVKSLRRDPKFTFAAVTVVALGIGATTAIFSAANAYFFRPLPFGAPDRVLMLYETNPEYNWTHATAAPANFLDWRERVNSFDDVAAYSTFVQSATYVVDNEPRLLRGSAVTGNFFSVLAVPMGLGRGFLWDETWDGEDGVMVLSHGLWMSEFGADPNIVGRVIQLGQTAREVVGVAPRAFRFPTDQTQFWIPLGWAREAREQTWFRRAHMVRSVARLSTGTSREVANGEFQTVVTQLQQEYPETNRVMGAGMLPIRDFLTREIRNPLMLLLGSVGLLLLLSCVNVANLTLLRSDARGREIVLRYALGARRGRIVRLIITESVCLALVGGGVGLTLGWIGISLMERLSRLGIEGATGLVLDARVVGFAFAAAVICGITFGLIPSLSTTKRDVGANIGDRSRGSTLGRGGSKTTNVLVVTEVALAFVLVAGAALMVRSFWKLRNVDPGFIAEPVIAVQFGIPSSRYPSRDEVLSFYDRFQELLEARPGIERVGIVGWLPLLGTSWSSQFQAEGWPPERVGFEILHRRADRGYFEALGIPLIRGRLFEPYDDPDGQHVVVINETFAEEFFPGEDPIGQRIAYDRVATPESNWREIVGIVGDQNQVSPGIPARAEVFEFLKQDWGRANWIVAKTALETPQSIAQAREVLREMDPLLPLSQARPMKEVWVDSMLQEQLLLTLLGSFGVLALLLASVGVFTVVAQAARRRNREMGIRMALGATRRSVLSLVLARGGIVIGVGLLLGLGGTFAARKAISAQLFGVEPNDPLTLGSVVIVLGAVSILACYPPARRAATVDPVEVIREE